MKFAIPSLCLLMVFSLFSCSSSDPTPAPSATEPAASPTEVSDATTEVSVSAPVADASPVVLAEWDGGSVTLSQFKVIMDARLQQLLSSVRDPNTMTQMADNEAKNILSTLVDNYVLVLEAHRRNLTMTPAEQEELLKQIRSNYDSEQAYKDALAQSGQSEADLVRVYSSIKLAEKCIEDQRNKAMEEITPELLKEYYDAHIDLFTRKTRTDLNRVVIQSGDKRSPEDASELANRLYQDVQTQVNAAASLEDKRKVLQQCAKEHSDSWEAGYNYGFVTVYQDLPQSKEAFSREFLDESLRVPAGTLSPLIRDASEYTFFLVVNQFPSEVASFETEWVQNMLPNILLKEKMDAWRKSLQETYHVRIHEDLLRQSTPGMVIPFLSKISSATAEGVFPPDRIRSATK